MIALQNAGFTSSDGLECVEAEAMAREHPDLLGYCFYNHQDLVAAIRGRGLLLAFGSFDPDRSADVSVGRLVAREAAAAGLDVAWPGMGHERVLLRGVAWRRRGPELGVPLRGGAGAIATHFVVESIVGRRPPRSPAR